MTLPILSAVRTPPIKIWIEKDDKVIGHTFRQLIYTDNRLVNRISFSW